MSSTTMKIIEKHFSLFCVILGIGVHIMYQYYANFITDIYAFCCCHAMYVFDANINLINRSVCKEHAPPFFQDYNITVIANKKKISY